MTRWAPASLALVSVLFAVDGGAAFGLILHPTGETATVATPPPDVMGRWGTSACFVVIGPNHIITTRHQSNDQSMPVLEIGGESYQTITGPDMIGGPDHRSDIRVLRVTRMDGRPANLTAFASIYSNHDEVGKRVVIGGFGKVRGQTLLHFDQPWGYSWANGGRSLLWGENLIDLAGTRTATTLDDRTFTSPVIQTDFDAMGVVGSLSAEAAAADGDSGGGLFVYDDGRWKIVGLMAYAQHLDRTMFRDRLLMPKGDWNKSIRVGSFAPWINMHLGYEPVGGDTELDGDVDFADYVTVRDHFGEGDADRDHGDFDGDGQVSVHDYLLMKRNYGFQFLAQPIEPIPTDAGEGAMLPEPGTLLLLAAGAAAGALPRRKRRRPGRRS